MKTKFETGATSHKVNDLILFAENTEGLYLQKIAIIKTILKREQKLNGSANVQKILSNNDLPERFRPLLNSTIAQYRREFDKSYESITELNDYLTLTAAEQFEFCVLMATDEEMFYNCLNGEL